MYKTLLLLPLLGLTMNSFSQTKIQYPVTQKGEMIDNYFGVKVADPYRWLEDDRSDNTAEWVKKENEVTENYMNQITARDKIKARLTELWNFSKQSAPFKKGELFFYYKNNGLQNQSVLYFKRKIEETGQILLDPNLLSTDGTISLNDIAISKNGRFLAYSISKAGSDWVEIHFKDIAKRTDLTDTIKWAKFTSIGWKNNGIFYSRYDAPTGSALSQKNQNHKVYYHQLGTSQSKDKLIMEDRTHPDYNFSASVTDDENFLMISVSQSTSGNKLLIKSFINPNKGFVSISDNFNWENNVIDNIGNTFYMQTNANAPKYKLVSFSMDMPNAESWKTLIPESKFLLESARLCNNKIVCTYLQNACSKLQVNTLTGEFEKDIELPGICKISSFNSDKTYNFATYSVSRFTGPEEVYYLNASDWTSKLVFKPDCKFDSEKYITKQVFYKSKDGTPITMFMTYKSNLQLNENTPCFVYGYGGFNISLEPEFKIDRTVFLEAGGIYCVPNIRGGGEYGEDWHKAGTKCKKQNVFDDFIAACDFLVKSKYTSYDKIAIHGRSNGGLLIGAVITQRPDICKVALPTVGVLDMLRFHLFTIGRAWTGDYGSSDNKEEFNCLFKYSPLHNVKSVKYPATLILTGDHDDRVVPAHSFKFAATLQEKNKGDQPVLIRIDVNAGHGAGKPTAKQIDEFGDMWSFVFYNLGINVK